MTRATTAVPGARRPKSSRAVVPATRPESAPSALPTSLEFFSTLVWIDGKPLVIEPYRQTVFRSVLDTFRPDGVPVYNMALVGRAKKNYKSTDLVLAALYCLLVRESIQGNNGFILANDEDQAGDDLSLAKKLIAVNPVLDAELEVLKKEVKRRDGRGSLKVLPARDAIGQHGKTALFIGYDEIHGYRNYDLLEALAPDPTRADTLTWISSYDTIFNSPGIPLYDFKVLGKAGTDPRMYFSWYSGEHCTDPAFAELEPELRANPSIATWPEGRAYLDQQRRRLPTHKFRRLHLNMPGAPNGAFLDQGAVLDAIVPGRRMLPPQNGLVPTAFVDMSGGSADDAVLCLSTKDGNRAIINLVVSQDGPIPFNPRQAVKKFSSVLHEWGIREVWGDNYAGQTFKADFMEHGIRYRSSPLTTTEIYEAFEPMLNAGEIELPDIPKLQEQLLTLVVRGTSIGHQPGDHDDYANSVCGAAVLAKSSRGAFGGFTFAGMEDYLNPDGSLKMSPAV
jgi:hypothetical protein